MLAGLKYRLKPIVERSVRLQALGQLAMVRFGMFLPHDADYFGLRHLVGEHDNSLFVDIGANQGTSVLSFRHFDKSTPIVSIEANQVHRAALERIGRKDHSFEFRLLALGAEPGELTLYTPRWRSRLGSYSLHTMASSNREQLEATILSYYGERFARAVVYDIGTAEVVSLDSLELQPSIIKIDTEGAELDVLRGGRETLATEAPYVLIEKAQSNFADCRRLLESLAYVAYSYDRTADAFREGPGQSRNIYFVPRTRCSGLPTS